MDEGNLSETGVAIGLDVGDRFSSYCILERDGSVRESGRVRTSSQALAERFASVPVCRIALEVGTHSPWISRLLEQLGHEVYVANPSRLRFIYGSQRKNDRTDAEALARVVRLDPRLLAPIQHRGAEGQRDLALLRSRRVLVRGRTRLVNHVRAVVKASGGRLPSCSADSFADKVAEAIPEDRRVALTPLLGIIASMTDQIHRFDQQVVKLIRQRYPDARLLLQVPGVGPITALAFVLVLEDPARFPDSRTVGAYLGLVRRQFQSGEQDPERRITKAGDEMLRSLLVQCAQWTLGPFGSDTDLRRWGLALARRGRKNAKKRAVVAVARKLATLLHRLWRTGQVYEPLRSAVRTPQPAKLQPRAVMS
jgi:transposase